MRYERPITGVLAAAVTASILAWATPSFAQANPDPNAAPNPYRLDEGWGAGVTFASPTPAAIAEAVLTASHQLGALRARAAGQGAAWREVHSLEAYLDHVIARLEPG